MKIILTLLFFILCPFILFAEQAALQYEVQWKGVESPNLLKTLKSHSQLLLQKERPLNSNVGLRRRADSDLPTLLHIVRNAGYYEATITYDIQETSDLSTLILTFRLGEEYRIASVTVEGAKTATSALVGEPAQADTLIEEQKRILTTLHTEGYPFASAEEPKILVDTYQHTVAVSYIIQSGERLHFGEVKTKGLVKVKKEYILKHLAWTDEEWFDSRLITETQRVLERSGLFQSVELLYNAKDISADGKLPITIVVSESKHRSIALGLDYTSHKGLGGLVEWQHRNIWGMGTLLSFNGNLSSKQRQYKLLYRHFDFMEKGQNASVVLEEAIYQVKAYRSHSQKLDVWIDRPLTARTQLSIGPILDRLTSSESDNNRLFILLSLSCRIQWNNFKGGILSKKGLSLEYFFHPYIDLNYSTLKFLLQRTTIKYHFPLWKAKRWNAGLRLSIGSILGASNINLPPPKRFYIGSEQSLRGYDYLTVSPLNQDKPIGGRSLIIYSAEIKIPISDNISIGPFFDCGNVYESTVPQFTKHLLKSTGIQGSYDTAVGPLSLTVALPLDRRKGVDSAFQIYVSLGKSF